LAAASAALTPSRPPANAAAKGAARLASCSRLRIVPTAIPVWRAISRSLAPAASRRRMAASSPAGLALRCALRASVSAGPSTPAAAAKTAGTSGKPAARAAATRRRPSTMRSGRPGDGSSSTDCSTP